MIELFYQLNALYNFYKSAHWLSKSDSFYQDHIMFERLYSKLDDEMDGLAELMLGNEDKDNLFDAKRIADESGKITPESGKNSQDNFEIAFVLEERILKKIETLNESKIPVGLYNHIADIAENHLENKYLLERRLTK